MINTFTTWQAWLSARCRSLSRRWADDKGATTLEYVIIAAVICAAAVIVTALIVAAINSYSSQIPTG